MTFLASITHIKPEKTQNLKLADVFLLSYTQLFTEAVFKRTLKNSQFQKKISKCVTFGTKSTHFEKKYLDIPPPPPKEILSIRSFETYV